MDRQIPTKSTGHYVENCSISGFMVRTNGKLDILDIFGDRPIDQLHIGHLRFVTCPISAFDNSNISARSCLVTRSQIRKQLGNARAIPKSRKDDSPIANRINLRSGNERLYHAPQFFGLGQRSLNQFGFHQ